MKFNHWINVYILAVNSRCIFTTHELHEAWLNGKSPSQVAAANDALAAEYAQVYGQDMENVLAA